MGSQSDGPRPGAEQLRDDLPVEIGGVTFTPGKHVWADADGVLGER